MTAANYRALLGACAMAVVSAPTPSRAALSVAYCGGLPAAGFDRPPNVAHVGHYDNPVYRYSVNILRGLTAYSSPIAPQRGFGIVLSWSPRAFVQVDAVYDVFYDITAEGVHRRDLNAIRLHDQVVNDSAQDMALARVPAARYRTDAQCRGDAQIYRHDAVIVMLNREIYRLSLQTTPARYEQDERVLDALIKSWRWVK